jgi:hypothetical protein
VFIIPTVQEARGRRILSLRLAQAKLRRPYLKNKIITKKGKIESGPSSSGCLANGKAPSLIPSGEGEEKSE